MKYFNFKAINLAIQRLTYENSQSEHRVGSIVGTILPVYFPAETYTITPEQIQIGTFKRPDFTIEKVDEDRLIIHCFVELKSLTNSNFNDILDQLSNSIMVAMDNNPNVSAFIIAVKGLKIAFYTYHNCIDILDDANICHYKGFIPLHYSLSYKEYLEANPDSSLIDYLKHFRRLSWVSKDELIRNGVEMTNNLPYPHIFDLLKHKEYVHKLFQYASSQVPGTEILD